MSVRASVLSFVLLLSVHAPLFAQEEAAETIPSRWMMTGSAPMQPSAFSDGTEVVWGDPRWGAWAERRADDLGRFSQQDLGLYMAICRVYGVEASVRPLTRLAQRLVEERMGPGELRGSMTTSGFVAFRAHVIRVAAFNAHRQSARDQDRSRRDLLRLMEFETRVREPEHLFKGAADESARAYCAAGLVMLDEDAGRDFLLEGYRIYLIGIEQSPLPRNECRDIMEKMYDAKLIERIEALRDDPAITNQKAQNNINTLLEILNINGMSAERLMAVIHAPGNGYNERGRRYRALKAIGSVGTPADIAALEAINFPDDPVAEGSRICAVQMIRCLHWRDLDE